VRLAPPPCSDSERFCCRSSSLSRMDMVRESRTRNQKGTGLLCPLNMTAVLLCVELFHVLDYWSGSRLGRRYSFVILREPRRREHNAVMDGIYLQHLELHRLPFLDRVTRLLDVRNSKLRHRHETFDVAAEIDDDTLVHEPHDTTAQLGATRVCLADPQPRILLRLLQSQRDALVLGVDVQNQHVDLVTLLHDFRWVLDPLGPRHVGDVNQAVDARLDLDERAERRQVADLAAQPRPDRILLRQRHPRILLGLFHAERDFLFGLVNFQDDRFDRLADRDELGRMPYVAVPAHLGDVHQTFDARLELDERTVVRDRDDLALHARSNRILRGDVLPGIGLQLFQAE